MRVRDGLDLGLQMKDVGGTLAKVLVVETCVKESGQTANVEY